MWDVSDLGFSIRQFTHAEVDIMTENLIHNTTLTTLRFATNKIGLDEYVCRSLGSCLSANVTLTDLSVHGNHLNTPCGHEFVEVCAQCPNLTSVSLTCNGFGDYTGKAGALFLANTNLRSLDLSSNSAGYRGTRDLAHALQNNTSLHHLTYACNNMRAKASSELILALKDSNIESLDLSWNSLGGLGSQAIINLLGTNTTLTCLRLSRANVRFYDLSPRTYPDNTTLTELILYGMCLTVPNVTRMVRVLRNLVGLRTLNLSHMRTYPDFIYCLSPLLKQNPYLETLDVGYRGVFMDTVPVSIHSRDTLKSLFDHNLCLRTLSLSGKNINSCFNVIANHISRLERLDLSKCDIDYDTFETLMRILKSNTSLHTLDLSDNEHVITEGIPLLAEIIKINTTLVTLDLRCRILGKDQYLILEASLRDNPSLTSIGLDPYLCFNYGLKQHLERNKYNTTMKFTSLITLLLRMC